MSMSLQFYDEKDAESIDDFALNNFDDLKLIKANADRFYLKDKCVFRILDGQKQPIAIMRFLSDVELFFSAMMEFKKNLH